MSGATSGRARIAEAFARSQAEGRRAALMPYLMAGYPTLAEARRIARAYVEHGADLLELGIPFSDPLADGPVIHEAAVHALKEGTSVEGALAVGAEVASELPVIVMCYANPILRRGVERFLDTVAACGMSGLIVPDLPLEEAPGMLKACDARGLALVPLVAPTTPADRLAEIGAWARGFLYTVGVVGTTGEREHNDAALPEIVARTRASTDVPIAVGFGIGTPEQAAAAAGAGADGVIVGTRLVREAAHGADAAGALVQSFADALR